jgi:hypothetical protein
MNFLRMALGINNEASVPAAPSKPPLTQQEIDDIVKDFLIEGRPSPTNQQIAEKLGRTIQEVKLFVLLDHICIKIMTATATTMINHFTTIPRDNKL